PYWGFFFSSRRRHTRFSRDWSSDVCSSDLLEAGSAYVDAAVHGDGLASLQYRPADGAETAEIRSTVTAPDVVQLERSGTTYRMRSEERRVGKERRCRVACHQR